MRTDDLVRDYLARLEAAAAALPPDERSELLEGIAEHIAEARADGAGDEAATRAVLDRLGAPEQIVAAARDEAPSLLRPRGTGLELAAVLMLTLGSVFPPVVGWVVGVVLLWLSPLWRVREKLLGTLVWPGGPGGALLLGGVLVNGVGFGFGDEQCVSDGMGQTTCTSGTLLPLDGLALLAVVVPPLVVAVLLYRTARRRAAALSLQPYDATPSRWGGLEVTGVVLLGLGSLLFPLVPSLVGLLLVLLSKAWTRREKVVGSLLVAAPLLLSAASVVGYYLSNGALMVGPAELGLLGGYLGLLLGPVLGAIWFLVRLSRRPAPPS